VDDDLRLRELLRRYLTEQGFHVVGAENAQTMNKLWMRERYDMLVLDLMLPGEDRLAICRRLRGRRQNAYHHADGEKRGSGQDYRPGNGSR
jgi:two-component system phosphate regulon response regulator OmpR